PAATARGDGQGRARPGGGAGDPGGAPLTRPCDRPAASAARAGARQCGRVQSELLEQLDRLALLLQIEAGDRALDGCRVLFEDLRDKAFASGGQGGVAGAPVLLAGAAFDQTPPLEGVHEVGDAAARDEDLSLKLAQQQRPLVVQRFEDGELAGGEAVARDVRLAVR